MLTGRSRGVALAALLAVVMFVGLAPAADAHPRLEKVAGRINSDLWRQILAVPTDGPDPFDTGGYGCFEVDGVLAPFDGSGTTSFSCDARRGQPVFIAGYTLEQSVYEELNVSNLTPPRDPSAAGLLRRDLALLPARPSVTFDGRPLRLVKVTGPLARVRLPQPNILGSPERSATFVAAGWVTAVVPSPGPHTIVITPAPTTGTPAPTSITTTINVSGRRHRA